MNLMGKSRKNSPHASTVRWLAVVAAVFLAGCSTTNQQPEGLTLGDMLREANIPIENGGTTYRVVGWSPRGFYPYGFSHFGYWGYPWYAGYRPGYYGYASLRGRYVYPYYPLYYPYYGATPWYVWGHPVHGAYWRRSHYRPDFAVDPRETLSPAVNVSGELLIPPANQFGSTLRPTPWTVQSGSLSGPRATLGPDGKEGRYTYSGVANGVTVISDPEAISRYFSNPRIADLLVNDGKWKAGVSQGGGRTPSQTINRSSSYSQSQQQFFSGSRFNQSGSSSRSTGSVTSSRTMGSQRAPSKARPKRPAVRPAQKVIR